MAEKDDDDDASEEEAYNSDDDEMIILNHCHRFRSEFASLKQEIVIKVQDLELFGSIMTFI